jgi:hypothetical protein
VDISGQWLHKNRRGAATSVAERRRLTTDETALLHHTPDAERDIDRFLSPPAACPDHAPPRSAWLQATPAGGGGTRGGTPAPRVQRGRRRGMPGRPAGRRAKAV